MSEQRPSGSDPNTESQSVKGLSNERCASAPMVSRQTTSVLLQNTEDACRPTQPVRGLLWGVNVTVASNCIHTSGCQSHNLTRRMVTGPRRVRPHGLSRAQASRRPHATLHRSNRDSHSQHSRLAGQTRDTMEPAGNQAGCVRSSGEVAILDGRLFRA